MLLRDNVMITLTYCEGVFCLFLSWLNIEHPVL